MKPDPVQREQGVWRLDAPDAFVEFARTNRLKVVGHTLVWAKDDRTPPWFYDDGGKPAFNLPIRFSTPPPPCGPSPALGQHNADLKK